MPRPVCLRCLRPASVCYCASLTRIDTATRIVILQHPRERRMPIGTARMASLCLPRATVHVGTRWDGSETLRDATSDPARPAALLYPGDGARDVLRDPPTSPVTLVVVDGTWSQTRSVVRDNPELAALPRFAFTAPTPSEYRVRREPKLEYVSTIEALMHVLGALEGDPERFRALLDPFRAMVDAHLAAQARCPRAPRVVRPRSPSAPDPHVPAIVASRFDDLVCVVGDGAVGPYAERERGRGDELLQWTACRVATGETFDVVAAPAGALPPGTCSRTGLDERCLREGVARTALFGAFTQFLRADDVVCTWGPYAARLYEANGGALPEERIDLRAFARETSGRKIGSLEQFAARTAPGLPTPLGRGRAGLRLAAIVRIVRAWRELAERRGAQHRVATGVTSGSGLPH